MIFNKLLIALFLLGAMVTELYAAHAKMVVVPEADRPAAPFFTTKNLHDSVVTLNDYKGKAVLLHFWATWCLPCIEEMPHMEALWKKYQDKGLVVVAVSVQEKPEGQIKAFAEKLNLSFPILVDPEGSISELYELSSMPTSYLISRDGKVVSRIKGTTDWFEPKINQFIENLLL